FLAEHALDIEHLAKADGAAAAHFFVIAGFRNLAATGGGHAAIVHIGGVFQAHGGAPSTATATVDVSVVWGLTVHLGGDEFGEARRLGAGAPAVQTGIFTGAGVHIVTDMALIGFDHIATEALAEGNTLEHLP